MTLSIDAWLEDCATYEDLQKFKKILDIVNSEKKEDTVTMSTSEFMASCEVKF